MNTKYQLADAFSAIIREWLTPDEFALAVHLNQLARYDNSVCHTHDFCDPNQAMLDAFEQVMGREMRIGYNDQEPKKIQEQQQRDSDADLSLSDSAWTLAKANDFQPLDYVSEAVAEEKPSTLVTHSYLETFGLMCSNMEAPLYADSDFLELVGGQIERVNEMMEWAKEFEALHADTDWAENENTFYDEIDSFMSLKIQG